MSNYHRAEDGWVEIRGRDVWQAAKRGAGLSFYVGMVAGAVMMFVAKDRPDDGFFVYLATFVGVLAFGTVLYIPLGVAVTATANSRGFLAGTLRFVHGVVVAVALVGMLLGAVAKILWHLMQIGA